jgi:iron complex transport system ATP-binding protein
VYRHPIDVVDGPRGTLLVLADTSTSASADPGEPLP